MLSAIISLFTGSVFVRILVAIAFYAALSRILDFLYSLVDDYVAYIQSLADFTFMGQPFNVVSMMYYVGVIDCISWLLQAYITLALINFVRTFFVGLKV